MLIRLRCRESPQSFGILLTPVMPMPARPGSEQAAEILASDVPRDGKIGYANMFPLVIPAEEEDILAVADFSSMATLAPAERAIAAHRKWKAARVRVMGVDPGLTRCGSFRVSTRYKAPQRVESGHDGPEALKATFRLRGCRLSAVPTQEGFDSSDLIRGVLPAFLRFQFRGIPASRWVVDSRMSARGTDLGRDR